MALHWQASVTVGNLFSTSLLLHVFVQPFWQRKHTQANADGCCYENQRASPACGTIAGFRGFSLLPAILDERLSSLIWDCAHKNQLSAQMLCCRLQMEYDTQTFLVQPAVQIIVQGPDFDSYGQTSVPILPAFPPPGYNLKQSLRGQLSG